MKHIIIVVALVLPYILQGQRIEWFDHSQPDIEITDLTTIKDSLVISTSAYRRSTIKHIDLSGLSPLFTCNYSHNEIGKLTYENGKEQIFMGTLYRDILRYGGYRWSSDRALSNPKWVGDSTEWLKAIVDVFNPDDTTNYRFEFEYAANVYMHDVLTGLKKDIFADAGGNIQVFDAGYDHTPWFTAGNYLFTWRDNHFKPRSHDYVITCVEPYIKDSLIFITQRDRLIAYHTELVYDVADWKLPHIIRDMVLKEDSLYLLASQKDYQYIYLFDIQKDTFTLVDSLSNDYNFDKIERIGDCFYLANENMVLKHKTNQPFLFDRPDLSLEYIAFDTLTVLDTFYYHDQESIQLVDYVDVDIRVKNNGDEPVGIFHVSNLFQTIATFEGRLDIHETVDMKVRTRRNSYHDTYRLNIAGANYKQDKTPEDNLVSINIQALSINENYLDKPTIYPNPNSGHLIQFEGVEPKTVSIFDMNGHCVLTNSPKFPTQQISLNNLPAGSYVVRIIDVTGKEHTERLIIQH